MLLHQSKFERKKKNYNKTKYSIKSSKNNINYINEKKCNKLKKKKKYTGINSDSRNHIYYLNNLKNIVRNRPNLTCSICLDNIYCNKTVINPVKLNCGHTFHPECIKKWLYINDSCPLCRVEISYYSSIRILCDYDLLDIHKFNIFLAELYDKSIIYNDKDTINKYLLITDKFRDYIYNSFNYESFLNLESYMKDLGFNQIQYYI